MVDFICPSPETTTTTIDTNATRLDFEFGGALPSGLAKQTLKLAWIEFLNRVGGWFFDQFHFEAYEGDEFVRTQPTDGMFVDNFHRVIWKTTDGNERDFVLNNGETAWYSSEPGVVTFRHPLPADMEFRALVSVRLTEDVETVPQFLSLRFSEDVLQLARIMLRRMPNKDWTNVQAATQLDSLLEARIRRARNQLRIGLATEIPNHLQFAARSMNAEHIIGDNFGGSGDMYDRPGYYNNHFDETTTGGI
ncbi:MAG: hypothetical protein AAF417_15020 [Pseudomonadota bacterium]